MSSSAADIESRDSDERTWACSVLGISAVEGQTSAAVAIWKVLADQDFVVSDQQNAAVEFLVNAGTGPSTDRGIADRQFAREHSLRREIADFIKVFFETPVHQRQIRWSALRRRAIGLTVIDAWLSRWQPVLDIDLALVPTPPPELLYHGTATRFLASIRSIGLRSGSRQHVHLSADIETAAKVGQRHGKPDVLTIQAATMSAAGHEFFLSDNGVWLTARVPVEYIIFSRMMWTLE